MLSVEVCGDASMIATMAGVQAERLRRICGAGVAVIPDPSTSRLDIEIAARCPDQYCADYQSPRIVGIEARRGPGRMVVPE